MTAPELIDTIEAGGGALTLNGDRIRYELPEDAAPMVAVLRQFRDEVFRVLRDREHAENCHIHRDHVTYQARDWRTPEEGRSDPYAVALEETTKSVPQPMPNGVRLLRWAPETPPVTIESWAVVNDVVKFIHTTLGQLQAAMVGKNWLAGNRSVRELVDRLEQAGVSVRVEEIR